MPAPDSPTHFLTGAELDAGRLDLRLHRAGALKEKPLSSRALERRAVALIFQKPSTRTRTSFEVGVFELALHCLPAHPGEGITEEDLYGDRQRIWFQAENRRHAQKALLELLVSPAAEDG